MTLWKIINCALLMIFCKFAAAQETPPPAPPAAPASDTTQFQNWVNSMNNGAAPLPKPSALIPQEVLVPQTTVTETTPVPAAAPAPSPPPGQLSQSKTAPPNESIPPPPLAEKKPPPPRKPVVNATKIVVCGEPEIVSKPLSYTKSQQMMLKNVPVTRPPSQDSVDAFNMMMQRNMPLTPQQVVQLRQLIDSSQRAAAIPPTIPPKPVSTTLLVNLSPGATPPAIRLAQGYVTSLVFIDASGSPWPIASFDIGDPKATNIQWDGKSNILVLQAVSPYSNGDLVVRLEGLGTPITLELISGQRVVDFRVDIHVPGLGPESKELPIGIGLPNSANQLLLNVLEGIAPPGSKQLNVIGCDSQAWLLGNRMFLRTRFTVLSPGWIGKMVSPDGMIAYEMPRSSTVLISRYGEPVEMRLEGF